LPPLPAPLLPQPAASSKVTMIPWPIRALILVVSSLEDYGAASRSLPPNTAPTGGEIKLRLFVISTV
jgi:hypothetical protein